MKYLMSCSCMHINFSDLSTRAYFDDSCLHACLFWRFIYWSCQFWKDSCLFCRQQSARVPILTVYLLHACQFWKDPCRQLSARVPTLEPGYGPRLLFWGSVFMAIIRTNVLKLKIIFVRLCYFYDSACIAFHWFFLKFSDLQCIFE